MDDLLINNIEYTIPLEDAQVIIWQVQREGGEEKAREWMQEYLARFN